MAAKYRFLCHVNLFWLNISKTTFPWESFNRFWLIIISSVAHLWSTGLRCTRVQFNPGRVRGLGRHILFCRMLYYSSREAWWFSVRKLPFTNAAIRWLYKLYWFANSIPASAGFPLALWFPSGPENRNLPIFLVYPSCCVYKPTWLPYVEGWEAIGF